MKSIVVLIPGLFDSPLKQLEGLSPLEKAQTPTLDEIAQQGQWIRVQPPKGGLELSLLELFGLESSKTNLSLSSLEVYSKKYPFKPNQSAFLFQLISLYEDQVISMDEDLLKENELGLFCSDLNENFGSWAHFMPINLSSGVCVLKEPFKPYEESNKDLQQTEKKYTDLLPPFLKTKERLEKIEAIHAFLNNHPLNLVRRDFEESPCNGLFFYEGGAPLNAIVSKRFYQRFCLYSPKSSSRGLANLLEIAHLNANPDPSFAYLEPLIQEVGKALESHQTVVLEHHDILESTLKGKLLEKIKRLEYLDRNLLEPLMRLCKARGVQLILSPFKQSSIEKRSLLESPVPWVIYNPLHKKGLEPILSFRESEFNRIQGSFTIRALAAQFLY